MTQMDASIIILTKNGGDNFPRLLDRIYSQQYGGTYEVIVIDSGSTDGTLEVTCKFPLKLVQIKPEQFHHGRTRNLGADMAQGRYLVYITQDALPINSDWLQKLTDNFADAQIAMVVGRQIPWKSTKPPEEFFYYYNFPDFKLVVKSNTDDYFHDNVFISDVNSAYRKDAWLKQKFSESIVTAEDKEIAIRLLADGYNIIYEPAAAVYHSHNYGLRGAFEKSLDYGLSLKQGVSRLSKSNKNLGGRVAEYILAEYHFLNDKKCLKWVPYSIIYESVKYAGLFMGKNKLMAGPMARRTKPPNE